MKSTDPMGSPERRRGLVRVARLGLLAGALVGLGFAADPGGESAEPSAGSPPGSSPGSSPASSPASSSGSSSGSQTGPRGIEEPIRLQLQAAGGGEVLAAFASILGAELVADPGLDGPVSLDLDAVPLGRALDQVCEGLGCAWALYEGEPAVLRIRPADRQPRDKISLSLRDADLVETLRAFQTVAGVAALELDPELAGSVTVELRGIPWDDALTVLCRRMGCRWEVSETTAGGSLGGGLRIRRSREEGGGSVAVVLQDRSGADSVRVPAAPVRLTLSTGDRTVQTFGTLGWRAPRLTMLRPDRPGERVLAVWLPLPAGSAVLALVVDCAEASGKAGRATRLEPFFLETGGRRDLELADGTLTFEAPTASARGGEESMGNAAEAATCGVFPPLEVELRRPGLRLHLRFDEIGDAVVVPAGPGEAAYALVALARTARGGLRLALVEEAGEGRLRSVPLLLAPGERLAPPGHRGELRLEADG